MAGYLEISAFGEMARLQLSRFCTREPFRRRGASFEACCKQKCYVGQKSSGGFENMMQSLFKSTLGISDNSDQFEYIATMPIILVLDIDVQVCLFIL